MRLRITRYVANNEIYRLHIVYVIIFVTILCCKPKQILKIYDRVVTEDVYSKAISHNMLFGRPMLKIPIQMLIRLNFCYLHSIKAGA